MKIEIKIEPSIPLDSPEYLAFIAQMNVFYTKMPLKSVKFKETSAPPNPIYSYKFKTNDGRDWNQTINFSSGLSSEPYVNLPSDGTGDVWLISELSEQIGRAHV